MNPLVSKIHDREVRWKAEFTALRQLCLGSGLTEELKWGKACYVLDDKNVVLIQGFKAYCALLFLKGALLKDPNGALVQQTESVQSARQLRFVELGEIERQKSIITKYIREAVIVERSGAKVPLKALAQFKVPTEFSQRLKADPKLARAFEGLTPGRRKGYLLHFSAAKQSATRIARIERHADRIRRGLGLDD